MKLIKDLEMQKELNEKLEPLKRLFPNDNAFKLIRYTVEEYANKVQNLNNRLYRLRENIDTHQATLEVNEVPQTFFASQTTVRDEENFTTYYIIEGCNIPDDDNFILNKLMPELFSDFSPQAESCDHEGDCCGEVYPSSAYVEFNNETVAMVSQRFTRNI